MHCEIMQTSFYEWRFVDRYSVHPLGYFIFALRNICNYGWSITQVLANNGTQAYTIDVGGRDNGCLFQTSLIHLIHGLRMETQPYQ